MCQGQRKRELIHDFWWFGTSDTKHSGFCFPAQNNILPCKPHPTALCNNSCYATWRAVDDNQPPWTWLMTPLLSTSFQAAGAKQSGSFYIPEKLKNVIVGALRQKHFLECSPNNDSMTLKAWEGEGSGEEPLHATFRKMLSYSLMKTSEASTVPLMKISPPHLERICQEEEGETWRNGPRKSWEESKGKVADSH